VGCYTGGGNRNGTLGIATATVNSGNANFMASVAIHESAHDLGCDDLTTGSTAQEWADYCVPNNPQIPRPPPQPCANM